MRTFAILPALLALTLSGCGYHTLGSAAHLPPDAKTLAIPVFGTHTETYHTETVLTQAVIREFAARTRLRVTPVLSDDADVVLYGNVLKEYLAPLTYNASTQQSSSFVITVIASVRLVDRSGKVLYENKNYVYREQYQSTSDLPTFLQEDPAAFERLGRSFAHAVVTDVLAGMD
jgi:outer membrane lipopolysaccharide assembly protein LptE/RlpB